MLKSLGTCCLLSLVLCAPAQASKVDADRHLDHWHHMHLPMVKGAAPTHTATTDGDWFAASTWNNGVPGAGARVLIPAGRSVTYGGLSAASILTINVAGTLRFSRAVDSTMLVDTLYVDAGGTLDIGTVVDPIPASRSVDITIADNGDIDVTQDPNLLSRGMVAFGDVDIHGAVKTVHVKVATDPQAGQTAITLAQAPQGWEVGDTLVLTGTRYSGWKWDNAIREVRYHGTQDEVLTISGINDQVVQFTPALQYDHGSPRADLKASVANFSRNVSFRSENGENAQIHHRGHTAIMHHPNADLRYAAFWHMGRTNKEVPSMEVADMSVVAADSNARGRYPVHVHRSGIDDKRQPAVAVGLAVFNSPGWGITHHDSNMIIHNCATFDTFGAGIVAETGNEIGSWTHNIAIRAEGNRAFNPKNGNDREAFDMGRSGAGFWFQGRMVRSVGNIAVSVNHGYVYLHRGSGMIGFPADAFMLPEALRPDRDSNPDDAPIFNFHDNEAFASTVGVYVVKANPNQQHDVRTVMSDFTAWEVQAGAAMEYTSHYLLRDFDIIGLTPEAFRSAFFGIDFGNNTTDMSVNGAQIDNFPDGYGIGLGKTFTDETTPPEVNQYVLIDIDYNNVETEVGDYDPMLDQILTSAELSDQFDIELDAPAYVYDSPATGAGAGVAYTGTKTDSIGAMPIPAGTDDLGSPVFEMIGYCETVGYRTDSASGDRYMIIEEYFTDRASGQIEKVAIRTRLGQAVADAIDNQFTAWGGCLDGGAINLSSQPPVANDDFVPADGPVTFDPLANDSDPDGDSLLIDGVVAPQFGDVFIQPNGHLLYQPDFDFSGVDRFRYWASDNQGNFTPATITINVIQGSNSNDAIFANSFEG